MSRINLDDTLRDIFFKMSEGNPGAISVLMKLLNEGSLIDPQAFDSFANILGLDSIEIYGSRIWMLYKDVCRENLRDVIMLLRANQLGFVDTVTLKSAIMNHGQGLDMDELSRKVEEFLPQFQKIN